ncbi:MAG: hypothetical protein FWD23_16105 [Oscillospiraceae bacterium]|nr:hypothetical protein [Oscillospiraceae bacterium]
MFEMTVTHGIKIHDNLISVAGPCSNRHEFNSRLADDDGNIYEAHIPLGKTLVFDDSKIMIGIFGQYSVESLQGKTLKTAD